MPAAPPALTSGESWPAGSLRCLDRALPLAGAGPGDGARADAAGGAGLLIRDRYGGALFGRQSAPRATPVYENMWAVPLLTALDRGDPA
jgi:hypothetical protein